MKQVISNLFIALLIGGGTVTTGATFVKLVNADHGNIQQAIGENDEHNVQNNGSETRLSLRDKKDDDEINMPPVAIVSLSPTSSPSSTSSTASLPAGVFTAETLALHNSPNDCYIAHNGTVYNVSSEPSWSGCQHHGARGGIDITPFFPHPISYLANMPKMGTYQSAAMSSGGSSSAGNSTVRSPRHDDDDDEYEDDDSGDRESFDDD